METHVTVKGRITIPASLRRKYGIKKGTRIMLTENGNSINLKPITDQYLRKLQGSLKGVSALKTLLEFRQIESK
jgi:AbrB family looped-hinge helix DNA binding protein